MRQALAPGALVVLVALGLVAAGPAPPAPAQEAGGDLYACGPLAPLGLLLEARDAHQLALAGGVAGRVLERDRRALAETGLAAGTVRTRVTRLEATQAEAVGLRQRLANQAAAIGERLDRRRAMLATARAEVRALVRAERARREAARRALVAARPLLRARALGLGTFADAPAPSKVAAAAVRIALDQVGKPYRWGRAGRSRSTARDWSAGPTRTPGWRCPAPRASSGGRAATSRSAACAPATWCSGPPTRPTPRPSTTSPSTSARR